MITSRTHTRLGFCCLFTATVAAVTIFAVSRGESDDPLKAIHATTRAAENPVGLCLALDGRQVVGWISGTESFEGRKVRVTCGDLAESATVGADNVFTWSYSVAAPSEARFAIDELKNSVHLRPLEERRPSVFFVIDRTVYRPGQRLKFAGFVRRLDADGVFRPMASEPVMVEIRSKSKNTLAGKLKLHADDFGRITGAYRFTDADALDDYTVAAKNFAGSATVRLAEFRKSKVKLTIKGDVQDGVLQLTFRAVDFLDKPVPGAKVHFTAQIVAGLDKERGEDELDPTDYVYHADRWWDPPLLEDLSDTDRLLIEGGFSLPRVTAGGETVLASLEGDVEASADGQLEHSLQLDDAWLADDTVAVVSGVLVDQNGREQRASTRIPLPARDGDSVLTVEIPKRLFETGEEIAVQASPNGPARSHIVSYALVAMRLEPAPPTGYSPYYRGNHAFISSYQPAWNWQFNNSLSFRSWRPWQAPWNRGTPQGKPLETLATAVSVGTDGRATLVLSTPGPYRLVAVGQRDDGATVRASVGCVVRQPDDVPALVLEPERTLWEDTDELVGTLYSRFIGARVLLTLRDSCGIRTWQTLTVSGNATRFRLRVPDGIAYGCHLEARYVDRDASVHYASRPIRIRPSARMLSIETATEEAVSPGETVSIDISVNRREPVDLVVSIYDQSLLGIAADKSVDIRSFYLADNTVRAEGALEALRARLGDLTINRLRERAEEALENDVFKNSPEGQLLAQAVNRASHLNVYACDVMALLQVAGVRVVPGPVFGGWSWQARWEDKERNPHVADLLRQRHGEWEVHLATVGEVFVLTELHESHKNNPASAASWGYRNGGFARGDARYSVSANAFHSFAPSAQSFISHMPVGGMGGLELAEPISGSAVIRRDFSDSAFFDARVRTDERGKATVEFKLPDSLTNWQIVVTGITGDMHVGTHKTSFRTFRPVMVWPMLPRVFTRGDKVDVFASVHNRTERDQEMTVEIEVHNGKVLTPARRTVTVPAKSNRPVYWTFEPAETGFTEILMSASCRAGEDASLKRLPVVPCAVERAITASGFAEGTGELVIPQEVDLERVALEISLAPSLAADMADTLQYLVQYPHGCVEQTMSRFLPVIKVAEILDKYDIDHDDLAGKIPGYVEAGTKRLLQLQNADGGWGWHGNGQTHEMMTPYALYGLLEAEKAGFEIGNDAAVSRGIQRLESFISGMGENQAADRIYCMYVYAHRKPLRDEWWTFVDEMRRRDELSDYALALALEMAAAERQHEKLAADLAAALRKRCSHEGSRRFWKTADFSRWGNNRGEITAAALKALVAHNPRDELIPGILEYFVVTKRGNRWNSTKDTAMIIYAVCDYLATRNYEPSDETTCGFRINDGEPIRVTFDSKLAETVSVAASSLRHGTNTIAFIGNVPGVMYRAVLRYQTEGAEIAARDEGLEVRRNFYLLGVNRQRERTLAPGDTVARGSYIESEVSVTRKAGDNMRYVLVSNPKPSCCETLPTEDTRYRQNSTRFALREDKTIGTLWHHEQTGSSLSDRCILHAELAGEYLVPPSSVELMYATDVRGHSASFRLVVDE